MAQDEKASWFAVYTKPRQEHLAREHLERQGFKCYLPLAINPYQRRSAGPPRVEPLFPRYLFLNAVASQQSLGPIRSTRGVSNLIRFGHRIVEVREAVIDAIVHRSDPETGIVKLEPVELHEGDSVRVFDGPLAGLRGIFQEHKGQARALLLMKMLGTESTIEIDTMLLQKTA